MDCATDWISRSADCCSKSIAFFSTAICTASVVCVCVSPDADEATAPRSINTSSRKRHRWMASCLSAAQGRTLGRFYGAVSKSDLGVSVQRSERGDCGEALLLYRAICFARRILTTRMLVRAGRAICQAEHRYSCRLPCPSLNDRLRAASSMAFAAGLSHSTLNSPIEPSDVIAATMLPV